MTKHKGIRLLSLAIAFVFLCSSALTTLVSTNVSANVQNLDSLYYTEDLYNQVSKRQHYWWLYGCMRNADITNLNASQLNSWDFFEGNQATGGNDQESALGHMYDINGSTVPCANQDVVKTAAAYLGKTDPKAFFCGLQGSVGLDATMIQQVNCTGTNPAIWTNTASGSQLAADYKTDVGGEPANTRAMQYMRAYASLMQGCQVTFTNAETYDTANAARGGSTDSTIIGVPVIVKNDRDIFVKKYKTGKIGNLSNALILVGNSSASDTPWTTTGCTELRNIADDMALDYQIYLTTNKDKVISSVAGPDSTPGTTSGGEPTCEVSGFGWVICPLINMFAEVTNTVAEFLDDYLKIEPLTFDTDSALYKGWSSLLGVANVLLILAILAIVFSQATSLGISNYGVKKMLPKVVAAAILINISYFICAVLVDISNIVGAGIADLITGTIGGAGNTGGSTGIAGGIRSFTDAILGGIFAVSGIVVVAFFFLIPAVISILTIFIVIAVRSAIITLLIILSPLAFAAWVLPNTEKYFKKWLDLFTQMLVIYPAIMAIFAASTVAASIVVSTGSDVSIQDNPGPGNFFPLLIGLLIQALPLLALPALIKGTSSVLGRIESATRGQIKKYGGDAADARVQGMKKIGMAAAAQRFDREYSPGGANRFTRGSKTALGRAVGIAARAPQRRALWEQRVGNAEQQQKTLLAEHAASNPQSRAARTVDTTKDLAERGDVADKTQKRRYEESRVFGATPNERGARAIESATLDNELRNAEEVKKRAFNATAIQAPGGRANQSVLEGKAIGLETKAQEEALDKRFKRERNAASSAPAGTAPGAVLASGAIVTDTGLRAAASETQSKTNETQIKNLDEGFQEIYDQQRNANPGGRAAQAQRQQKTLKKEEERLQSDFDASYDQGILDVRSGTAAPAWATGAEAAATGAATAKGNQDAVAKRVEGTYDDIVNSGLQGVAPSAAAAAAGAARRNLEQSTLGATNAAGRVKSTLTTQGASGFDTTLQGLQQDAIEIGKTQKLADERVQETYKQDIVSNPTSTRANLEKELTDVAKEGERVDAQIKDQYAQDVQNNVNNRGDLERNTIDAKEALAEREGAVKTQLDAERAVGASDPLSATAFGVAAAERAVRMEGQTTDQATSAATVKRRVTQEKTTGSLRGNESAKVTAETRLAQDEAALGEVIAGEKQDVTTELGQAERDKRLADESKRQAETDVDLEIKSEEDDARRKRNELIAVTDGAENDRNKLEDEVIAQSARSWDMSLSKEEQGNASEAALKAQVNIDHIDALREEKQREFDTLSPEQLAALQQSEQKFVQEQQTTRLSRREQDSTAGRVTRDEEFAREAAGGDSADEADIVRVKAGAISKQLGAESEEANNRVQLLGYGARQSGMQVKGYVRSVLEAASAAGFESTTYTADNGEVTPVDDQTLISMAEYAAANGEIPFLEQLRSSKPEIQDALDDIIRRNSGTIMAKGGFHLATNFKLRAGPDFDPKEMDRGRLETLAGSSAEDVGGMKFMQFVSTVGSVTDQTQNEKGEWITTLNPEKAKKLLTTIDVSKARTIASTLHDVLTSPSARAKAGDRISYVVQMAQAIKSAGISGVDVDIPEKDVEDFGVGSGTTSDGESGDAGSS